MSKHERKIKYLKSNDSRSHQFNDYIMKNHPEFLTEANPDLILVTGGDGAMLHAIQDAFHHAVPFVGHAAGTLNYLMNTSLNYEEIVNKILDPNFDLHITETTSIKVDILETSGKLNEIGYAVNEVVLGQDVMGYHAFSIASDDGSFDQFLIKGSGLSISTDLGSTGYNFNLGGSVLPLGSHLWSVVGVVCNRYLNDILQVQKIEILNSSKVEAGKFSIFIDGIKKVDRISTGTRVVLSKGLPIKIAFFNKTDFIKKRVDISSRFRKG